MTLDMALRLTEALTGFAFTLQCLEHWRGFDTERLIYLPRLVLSLLLLCGIASQWTCLGLLALGFAIVNRFQGPYNGGSDRLSLLMVICLSAVHWAPSDYWREVAFGYLGIQLTLSYFMSGWVKVINPQWRNGQALSDVFAFSAYPVSESLRGWARSPHLLWTMSWCVMLLELLFPLALLNLHVLQVALLLTASFHFANACLFGLNRFFWIWIASYPALLWLQQRISS